MTEMPGTAQARSRFDKVREGDIVWLPGGFQFYDGAQSSFGRRCKVASLKAPGPSKGAFLLKDLQSGLPVSTYCVITRADLLKDLATLHDPEDRKAYLARYTLQPQDLAEEPTPASPETQAKPTLAQLKRQVAELQEENAILRAELALRAKPC